MGHHVGDKEFDGSHRLLVAQMAPLEGTDEVIGAGGNILIHIRGDRVRGPGHDTAARNTFWEGARLWTAGV
jgi:hypothetical protein